MTDDSRSDVSRRAVLAGAQLTIGGAIGATLVTSTVARAQAQPSVKQADAMYQTTPKDDQHCELCGSFVAPNTCQIVQGTISPNGWCQFFSPKD